MVREGYHSSWSNIRLEEQPRWWRLQTAFATATREAGRCPLRVIRDRAIRPRRQPMSAMHPEATEILQRRG